MRDAILDSRHFFVALLTSAFLFRYASSGHMNQGKNRNQEEMPRKNQMSPTSTEAPNESERVNVPISFQPFRLGSALLAFTPPFS